MSPRMLFWVVGRKGRGCWNVGGMGVGGMMVAVWRDSAGYQGR